MNRNQEDIVKYFQEFIEQERQQTEGTDSSTAAASSTTVAPPSPIRKSIILARDENNITKRPDHIHCNLEAKDLQVLKEFRVDFNNINSNGCDLRPEMLFQVWENYFARLHGPVYDLLVKDLWRQAECDNHYVVSHVLGKRIVITEKSTAQLLGLNHREGLRVSGKEKDMPTAAWNFLHKELYDDYTPEKPKSEYKVKTLFSRLRAWHKIILGYINPRPQTNSADYINTNQKYMMYCLVKKKKLCFPFIIFQYLRDSISISRTTSG